VQHNDARVERDANDRGGDQPQLGTGRSIRPRPVVPFTVLVADLCDGGLFLQGWLDSASAGLHPPDTVPLTQALAPASGSTQLALRGHPGEAL
jgi:hypothetical protein